MSDKKQRSTSIDTEKSHRFKIRHFPSLVVTTYKRWMEKEPFQLSAIVAYYAILSLPALIVLILNIVGGIWGRAIVQGEILDEITKALGQQTAESIRLMMLDRGNEETSFVTTIVGVGTLLYGATGVFYQLQLTLDKIWLIDDDRNEGMVTFLKNRAKAFGFILILGFLLLTSLLITALLSTFVNRLTIWFGDWVEAIFAVDFLISLFFIYFLFAVLFRFLPSRRIAWKAVRLGAAITSLLFLIGKYLLAFYFKTMEPGSTYGAAGSIILIMLWVSYSSLLLFFGAQFTKVYSDRYIEADTNT